MNSAKHYELNILYSVQGISVKYNVTLDIPSLHPSNYESIAVTSPDNVVTRDVLIYWENYITCNNAVHYRYEVYYLNKNEKGKWG